MVKYNLSQKERKNLKKPFQVISLMFFWSGFLVPTLALAQLWAPQCVAHTVAYLRKLLEVAGNLSLKTQI